MEQRFDGVGGQPGARRKAPQTNGYGREPGMAAPPQREYTLPGIMQYLQSQFTLAERNRMQNDLEKSSLKLKIVELESERNSLKLENGRMKLQLERLEQRVKELEKEGAEERLAGSQGSTGLLRSLSSRKKRAQSQSPTEEEEAGSTEEVKDLAEINTIDVKKLVSARQFLKSATSEIMYLLKSSSVELEDPLRLDRESYFLSPYDSATAPEFMEMNIPLEEKREVETNGELNSGLSSGLNSETSTIIEPLSSSHPRILRREQTTQIGGGESADFKTGPSELGRLIGGVLYCHTDDKVQSYSAADQSQQTTYTLPAGFGSVVSDIKANTELVVVAGEKSVAVFEKGKTDQKPLTVDADTALKNIDLDTHDNILLSYGTIVEVRRVNIANHSTTPVFTTNYNEKGGLLSARFIASPAAKHDLAILTTSSLVLQGIKAAEKTQVITLSKFDHFLLTSRALVVNLPQGLFLIDFSSLTAFNHVPIKGLLSATAELGACDDDSSLFYARVSPDTLEVFKTIETGDIFNIKTLTGLEKDAWCSVGSVHNNLSVALGSPQGVLVRSL